MSMYTFSARRARAFWSAKRCLGYGHLPFGPARVVQCSGGVRTLYLDFETHLYDLGGRNSEIRGREIGAEVNHGEQDFLQTALPDASLLRITITHSK